MSLNRVLNRPMFRREALRKGALKPVKANVGVMVGKPTSPAPVPSTQLRKGFQYNPTTGTYINPDVLKYNAKKYAGNVGRFGKGIAGMTGMYSGLEALGVPSEALLAMGAGELTGLGLGLSKKQGMQQASRFLTAPTRFAMARSPAMLGLAGLAMGGRGVYDKFQQEKLVKEYAKANNISEEKAMNIFNRDMAGSGGRPLSEFSYSDIAKYANKFLTQSPSAARKLAKPISSDRGVAAKNTGAKTEREIADEIRGYVNFVKDGGGRVYQDVDQLVKKYKEEDIGSQARVSNDQIMMPEDEELAMLQAKKADENAYKTAETLTQKIMLDTGADQTKASNIAAAIVSGDLSTEEIQQAASSDDVYAKIPNNAGDPNHPDAVKMKLTPGSFAMPDGTFAEARRDKETGDVYISQNGQLVPVTEQEGQFFEQKSDATLFDNVKLIADGYLSDKLLSDSIQLMESNKGKTAIGASGIFVNLIDLAKNIPGELRDGFFGANPTFEISQGDMSDKEYKKLQKRTTNAVEGLEEGIAEFLKNNPEASSVLAKLRVNARMLTYSLANSLKDKDRLTNRDLELIEQLTQTMTAGMTDEKIISQYKNLLQAVREKNKIRIGKLGISGYTQQDTTTILNSMGLGSYAPQYTTQKEFDIDSAQAAFDELMGIK